MKHAYWILTVVYVVGAIGTIIAMMSATALKPTARGASDERREVDGVERVLVMSLTVVLWPVLVPYFLAVNEAEGRR